MNKTLIATVLWLALMPMNGAAYNTTIHYYATVVALQQSVAKNISDDEMRVVTFCAQLPDETKKYDAVGQYRKFSSDALGVYWKWARADFGSEDMNEVLADSEAVRVMISVQQLLHGLTGGTAEKLMQAAEEIAKKLADKMSWNHSKPEDVNKLCALGFAAHLLGDALAHRQLDEPGIMYETGSGHFRDGTRPDKVLRSALGLDGWSHYSEEIPDSLPLPDDDRDLPAPEHQELFKELVAADKKWFGKDKAARKAIIDRAQDWTTHQDLAPDEHKNDSCQAYVNRTFPILVPKMCVPSCEDVWRLFSEVAIPEFASKHFDRKPALDADKYVSPSVEDSAPSCPAPDM